MSNVKISPQPLWPTFFGDHDLYNYELTRPDDVSTQATVSADFNFKKNTFINSYI